MGSQKMALPTNTPTLALLFREHFLNFPRFEASSRKSAGMNGGLFSALALVTQQINFQRRPKTARREPERMLARTGGVGVRPHQADAYNVCPPWGVRGTDGGCGGSPSQI